MKAAIDDSAGKINSRVSKLSQFPVSITGGEFGSSVPKTPKEKINAIIEKVTKLTFQKQCFFLYKTPIK